MSNMGLGNLMGECNNMDFKYSFFNEDQLGEVAASNIKEPFQGRNSSIKVIIAIAFCGTWVFLSPYVMNASNVEPNNYKPTIYISERIRVGTPDTVGNLTAHAQQVKKAADVQITSGNIGADSTYNILQPKFINYEEEKPVRSLAKLEKPLVYGSLTAVGVLSLVLSLTTNYITPLFDVNVAKVLVPMSIGFVSMIALDYLFRGRSV